MKFKAAATTDKGIANLNFLNKNLLVEQLAPLDGNLLITIETVDGDATDAQIYHFRNVVIPAFIYESIQVGSNDFTDETAEWFLLKYIGGVESMEEITENGKKTFSDFIDRCKNYIRQFFKTETI